MVRWSSAAVVLLLLLGAAAPAGADDVNLFRARNGARAMSISPALVALAREHAATQARTRHMSHDGFASRAARSGHGAVCENVAYGVSSTAAVVALWARSPGHRSCMLRGYGRWYGLAHSDGGGRRYWTLLVGG